MIERPILHGALFVSPALNVFVGGALVGAHLTKAKEPAPAASAGPFGPPRNPLIAAIRALPPERQVA